jgi:DNA-nicking Smr family endonuclease
MAKGKRRSSEQRNPFEPLDGTVVGALDLHGFQASEVRTTVVAFLHRAQQRSPNGLVHIITGKGRGSSGPPVLKNAVKSLLQSGAVAVQAWGEDLNGGGFLVRLGPQRR